MIEVFWSIMTSLITLVVPTIAIYILFDFIGSMIFNKK